MSFYQPIHQGRTVFVIFKNQLKMIRFILELSTGHVTFQETIMHSFCAYSSDYCTSNHIWIHPNNVPDILGDGKYCHCENTHIGGCVGGFQDFHCGVSSLDCRTNQFVLPLKLKEEHNHACFLCKQTASIDDAKVDELGRIRDNNTSHNANKTVTISVIGTMLVLGLVTICFVFLKRKKRRQKPIDSHSNHIDEVLDDDEVLDEKDVEDLNETKLV